MKVCLSVSYSPILRVQTTALDGMHVEVQPRISDWGISRGRRVPHYLKTVSQIIRASKGADWLLLANAGMEVVFTGLLRRLIPGKTRLACLDFLMPQTKRLDSLVARSLGAYQHIFIIRRGDYHALSLRFGIAENKCSFAHFPAELSLLDAPTSDGGYVYSAGWAHRDWDCLMNALSFVSLPSRISPGKPVNIPAGLEDKLTILPALTPDDGRRMMADCSVAGLVFKDTLLPSGPLVLLDAMALGKAVVASNVNGTRDYVTHGENALLVPPGDPQALADAIKLLMENPEVRYKLGANARETIREYNPDNLMQCLKEKLAGA